MCITELSMPFLSSLSKYAHASHCFFNLVSFNT